VCFSFFVGVTEPRPFRTNPPVFFPDAVFFPTGDAAWLLYISSSFRLPATPNTFLDDTFAVSDAADFSRPNRWRSNLVPTIFFFQHSASLPPRFSSSLWFFFPRESLSFPFKLLLAGVPICGSVCFFSMTQVFGGVIRLGRTGPPSFSSSPMPFCLRRARPYRGQLNFSRWSF